MRMLGYIGNHWSPALRLALLLVAAALLAGCMAAKAAGAAQQEKLAVEKASSTPRACPVTEPVRLLPPDDSAVQNPPEYGNTFTNADNSILASAWWTEVDSDPLRASKEGVKVGWFRPAGAKLTISGERIDAQAPPLKAEVPCCYPTRFQATGLYFPTAGCWRITANAAEKELSFVVQVAP